MQVAWALGSDSDGESKSKEASSCTGQELVPLVGSVM